MHNWCIRTFYRQRRQQHSHCPFLRMSVNGAWTIFGLASWIIYVQIGCRHPFNRYWLPLLRKTTVTCSLPHPDNDRQRSVNDFQLRILGNLCPNWLQTPIYQILAAFTGKNNSDMLPAASWEWASAERQLFWLLHICWSRHRTDLHIHKVIIHRPYMQKYNLSKVKHWFQISWYCMLQSMQKHILGCWKRDSDKILLTYSKNKSLNWIDGWTHWVTCWQPTQFRQVGSLPSNGTQVDSSGLLTTRTASLATVQVGLKPGPGVTVRNRC